MGGIHRNLEIYGQIRLAERHQNEYSGDRFRTQYGPKCLRTYICFFFAKPVILGQSQV